MNKLLKTFALILVGGLFLSHSALAAPLEGSNTISVRGQAERQIAPDTAFVVLGVVTQAESVEKARQENALKIERIIQNLKSYGISNNDISTSSFDLRPVYSGADSQQRKITGYSLENVLTIKVKNIKDIGNIVDTSFNNGANRLDGVRFAASNADSIQKELLQEAVKDGLEKARLVAGAGGKKVGTLLKVNINSNNYAYPETRMLKATNDAAGFASSQVFVGNLVVSAEVDLVYELN